eukprot:COSAG02_NODE_926_length_15856_cov_13.975566_4_plen_89_part_00
MAGNGSEILVYLGASKPYVGDYETTETYELHSILCELLARNRSCVPPTTWHYVMLHMVWAGPCRPRWRNAMPGLTAGCRVCVCVCVCV